MDCASRADDPQAAGSMRAARLASALQLAERAVAAQKACSPEHAALAAILLELGRTAEADAVIESAIRCAPGSAEAYRRLARVSLGLGRHERANGLLRRAAQIGPHVARHWLELAASERSFGRLDQAEAACDRAIALDAREYRSYLLRAELRVQSGSANHVASLHRELARPDLEDRDRVLLGYALAKELDDLGEYSEAFTWLALAAGIRRRQFAYDVRVDEHKLRRIIEAFPATPGQAARGRRDSSRFVFIFGLPRSGTTLLERILTGLPGVRSNGETDHLARTLLTAAPVQPPAGAPDVFARAAAVDWDEVAAGYARRADPDGGDDLVIEKQPMNYLYLGAIRRALPEARLILVSRAPLDGCFAMYRTLFGEAYRFSYDFQDLARYFAAYSRLIAHWRHAFGDCIHEVRYEDLVTDPLRTSAALAGALGLKWRDCAAEVERNPTVCLTQSAPQVRRPVNTASLGRWRHYRAHLEPLVAALREHGAPLAELD
jgi:tetratricopeptide (TPR) repeat protein